MKPRPPYGSSFFSDLIISSFLAFYFFIGFVLFGAKKASYLREDIKTILLVFVLFIVSLGRFVNYIPQFNQGNSIDIEVGNQTPVSLDTLLTVADVDDGQNLTWSTTKLPAHGKLFINAKEQSNGGIIFPHGITYTANWGYTGKDAFSVKISDGHAAQFTTVHVIVLPGSGYGYLSSQAGSISSSESRSYYKPGMPHLIMTSR